MKMPWDKFQKDVKSIRLRPQGQFVTDANLFQKDVKSIRLRPHEHATYLVSQFQKDVKSIRLRPFVFVDKFCT